MNKSSALATLKYLKQDETSSVPLENISVPEVISVFSYPCSGEKLKDSIKSFGFINPVLVSKTLGEKGSEYLVICGAKRIYAARELGLESVPVNVLSDNLNSEQEMFVTAFAPRP